MMAPILVARMRRVARHHAGTLAMAVAAIGFGALAVLGVRGHVAERIDAERMRLAPREPRTAVVVAKRDLAAGSTVDSETMAVREVAADGLPSTVVRPDAFEPLVGARLASPLRAGEPLLAGSVETAQDDRLAGRVRSGVRALTIAVDEVNALSGMLQPGDRIDLLLSARLPRPAATPGDRGGLAGASGADAPDVTIPLMQDVRVLATGRQVQARAGAGEAGGPTFGSITVEATPEQAQGLVVAQRVGRLTAVLRSPGDRAAMPTRPMDLTRLLGNQQPRTRTAPPTEIIVGGQGGSAPPWNRGHHDDRAEAVR